MKISMDDLLERNDGVAEMPNGINTVFSFAGPGGEEEEEETDEEPALDPDIVHSPVVPQTGGKPE
jgi:hypothetical protein